MQIFTLAAITLFGFALRLYHLDLQCFARDEYYTLESAPWDSVTIILWSLGGNVNPPLYYLFAHWSSVILGGVTSFSIRLPAAIFGTLCIPAGYFLGTEFRNRTLGILMAATISFLYPLIYYSQDGRAYTLVMLAFIGYTYFFIKVYRGDSNYLTIFYGSIFAMICLWSHLYSIIPLIISLCILATEYKRTVLYGSVLVILMCLPFIRYIEAGRNYICFILKGVMDEGWIAPVDVAMSLPFTLLGWGGILIIPLTVFTLWKYRDNLHINLIIIATLTAISCLPVAALTSISPRYALLVSPIILLIGLYPLSKYIDRQNTLTKKCALSAGIIFLLFLFNYTSLMLWYSVNICPLMNLSLSPWM